MEMFFVSKDQPFVTGQFAVTAELDSTLVALSLRKIIRFAARIGPPLPLFAISAACRLGIFGRISGDASK